MARRLELDPDRLFPADAATRAVARALYAEVAELPIVSPHGHTDPEWFAGNAAWSDATSLLLAPDHYLYRMLYSQGVALDDLGIPRHGVAPATDPRAAWRTFAGHYHLFRGTPSRLWMDHVLAEVFGIDVQLEAATADAIYRRYRRESWRRLRSARARCSTGSGSISSPPPKAHTTTWPITPRSGVRAGRAGSSRPIAPTR